MVVIVIMTIMTSLVVLNIGGVDQKSNAGKRVILLDLQKINKESLDQSRVLALETHGETDVSPFLMKFMNITIKAPYKYKI